MFRIHSGFSQNRENWRLLPQNPIFSVLWKEVEVLNETAAMMLGFVCGFIVGAWISSRLSYLLNMLEGRLLERERRAEEKEEG